MATHRRWKPVLFALVASPAAAWALVYLYDAIWLNAQDWNGFLLYHGLSIAIYWGCRTAPDRGWLHLNPPR